MKRWFVGMLCLSVVLALGAAQSPTASSQASDREAVRQAVLNYVEGVYNVEPARIERSVHPKLAKTGFYRPPAADTYRPAEAMTFEQLLQVARTWNKDGKLRKDAPREITLFEVQDQTASAKLVAEWGTDYFHLAKFDGKWMIVNVLWQSPPKPAATKQ
ncbi:MAG: nuclear transport factor 2 family protein [Blastocatellia bacterium]